MYRIVYAVILAFTLSPVQAAVLFSDNFNDETLLFNGELSNWAVSDGTIDVIGENSSGGTLADFFPGNGIYLDLDGTSGDAGTITSLQFFTFDPGVTYLLEFTVGRNPERFSDETLLFGVGTLLNNEILIAAAVNVLNDQAFSFVGDGSTGRIFFAGVGGDNFGPVIDNVSLSTTRAAVPLPAALPLFAVALGGLCLVGRRRRAD